METLNQEDIKELVNSAMHKLDKEDRKILRALYFKNTSINQLSKNLGISRSTAKYLRNRALNNLKKIIRNLSE
jgi:RNA polymerase sigma factor (sigma-70 family)